MLKKIKIWPAFLVQLVLLQNVYSINNADQSHPAEGIITPDLDSFYDVNHDYSRFPARMVDRDPSGTVFKMRTENNNSKFLRVGDEIHFTLSTKTNDPCRGHVRDTEEFFFVVYVPSTNPCLEGEYFRRGAALNMYSPQLGKRIYQGSRHRKTLLVEKDDFIKQLNRVNHFLWSFDQERIKVAAEYDQKILQIQKQKQKAMEDLVSLRKDTMVLQKELITKLDRIDQDLNHYRIERRELFSDRWQLDLDEHLPMGHAPQEIRSPEESSIVSEHRWHKKSYK